MAYGNIISTSNTEKKLLTNKAHLYLVNSVSKVSNIYEKTTKYVPEE